MQILDVAYFWLVELFNCWLLCVVWPVASFVPPEYVKVVWFFLALHTLDEHLL